ncbi:hypothetical protein ACSBR1_018954 [Camellia fascicularis]
MEALTKIQSCSERGENVMEQRGNGGWIPVGRQRKGGKAQGKKAKHGLFTIFVDNLPSAMDAKILFDLFTKFGIMKDVFIPKFAKRRIVTNSRFGFVRFDCHVAADIAIQKGNGLLVDDMVLEVKKATYVKNIRDEQSRSRPQIIRKHFETSRNRVEGSFAGQRSFADVLKGVSPTVVGKANLSLKVNDDGHGWLYDSAIVRLNTKYPTHYIENALKEKEVDQVLVRKGRGRDIVLTFESQEELKSNICNIKEWFKEHIQQHWRPIGFSSQFGWRYLSTKDLLSDSSNMKQNRKEGSSSNNICGSEVKGKAPEECCKEKDKDVEVAGVKVHSPNSGMVVNTVVEETKWDEGFNKVNGACTKEVEQREWPIDCHTGEESKETLIEESVHSPKSQVQVSTPGFIENLSGSRDGLGHGINLEVDLAHLKKVQLERFTNFARLHGHKAAIVSKHNSKFVIYRPTVAAIALSDLSEGATSPNNYLLEEAKATLQLGKSLGINFNGKEDVVLNKIIELELQDKERTNKEG